MKTVVSMKIPGGNTVPVRVRPWAPFKDCYERHYNLFKELKSGLQSLYGGRLHGIYLYGSRARGVAGRESDVDVLVVLDGIPSYSAEVDRTSTLIASLSLKHSVSSSRVFVTVLDWHQGRTPFLLNAREEAVAA